MKNSYPKTSHPVKHFATYTILFPGMFLRVRATRLQVLELIALLAVIGKNRRLAA